MKKPRAAMRMPIPEPKVLKAAKAFAPAFGQFAHKPPAAELPARMKRPHGGHGPQNPGV